MRLQVTRVTLYCIAVDNDYIWTGLKSFISKGTLMTLLLANSPKVTDAFELFCRNYRIIHLRIYTHILEFILNPSIIETTYE